MPLELSFNIYPWMIPFAVSAGSLLVGGMIYYFDTRRNNGYFFGVPLLGLFSFMAAIAAAMSAWIVYVLLLFFG